MKEVVSLEQYYTIKKVSSNYKNNQINSLKRFVYYCEDLNIDTKTFTPIQAKEYLEYLKNEKSCLGTPFSNSRINELLNAVNIFYILEVQLGRLKINPFNSIKKLSISKLENNYGAYALTFEEVKNLFDSTKNMKEKTILHLFYSFGLRRKEAEEITLSDIDFYHNRIIVRKGKGNKGRVVEASKKVMDDIKQYIINERKTLLNGKESNFLIISQFSKKIKGDGLYKKVLEIKERTNITKRVVPHILRASLATHYLDLGAKVETVKILLGHVELDTTHLYTTKHKPNK